MNDESHIHLRSLRRYRAFLRVPHVKVDPKARKSTDKLVTITRMHLGRETGKHGRQGGLLTLQDFWILIYRFFFSELKTFEIL